MYDLLEYNTNNLLVEWMLKQVKLCFFAEENYNNNIPKEKRN